MGCCRVNYRNRLQVMQPEFRCWERVRISFISIVILNYTISIVSFRNHDFKVLFILNCNLPVMHRWIDTGTYTIAAVKRRFISITDSFFCVFYLLAFLPAANTARAAAYGRCPYSRRDDVLPKCQRSPNQIIGYPPDGDPSHFA